MYNLIINKKLYNAFVVLFFLSFSFNSSFCKENTVNKNSYTHFHSSQNVNCQICHVSIDSKQIIRNAPKWIERPIETGYSVYSSETLDAVVGQPTGSSKLCLSCHDGTVAIDDLGGQRIPEYANLGTDLRNSHPVSFKYDSYLASKDSGLHDPVSSPSGLGGTIDSDMLVDGNLECISCHDIHGFTKIKHYLIKSNSKSRLCLACHDK